MAIINKAATFVALKPSINPPPHSNYIVMSFKPMSSKPEMRALVGAKGNFSSLRGGGGAGVLERPTFDQSQFNPTAEVEEGGDMGRLRDKKRFGSGDSYKVLLIDDARHTEKLVEKALPRVVPSVTLDGARKLFHESRKNGLAIVIVTLKEHAEFYAQMMIRSGLRSAIESDSETA